MKNLFISFSGGETSARMTEMLLREYADRYDKIVVGFANTGEESEKTLKFVDNCDFYFGFSTVWVEAEVIPEKGKGTSFRQVDFATASRLGEPYEAMIKKFGIPNSSFPHCTRELKHRPLYAYLASIGWKKGEYDVAVGIRADEPTRRSATATDNGIIYPLLDWCPTTKAQINTYWREQPFRLGLKGYEGNCRWCWKKSNRKLFTLMDEQPDIYDFPERMEKQYGLVGPEFSKTRPDGYHRTFFRGNKSVTDLRVEHAALPVGWTRADDDAQDYEDQLSFWRCGTESCEIDWEEVA